MKRSKSLILFGLKHCGKSTLGALAGRRWGLSFRDLDDWLMELAAKELTPPPESCRALYLRSPEEFRRWEEIAAAAASEKMEKSPLILALGGGTVENSAAVELLRPRGIFVYLKEEEEILYRRIIAGGVPPFLDADSPRESWSEVYRRRDLLCGETADITLPLEGANPEEALNKLAEALQGVGLRRPG